LQRIAFAAAVVFCLSPWGSPPAALALGLVIAMSFGSPFPQLNGRPTRLLLQASVVLLGFGMDLSAIWRAGKDGILFTIVTIFGTLAVGYILGRALGIGEKISALISSGTAICGGSAIAAVGPSIDAGSDDMSVALGTVFILNSIALFLFPPIGHLLHLSEPQFGIWAAIAIHDTSSVVGAAGTYGAQALAIATTVKLARALWIAPVALIFSAVHSRKSESGKMKVVIPWFIFLFIAASVVRTYAPSTVLPSIWDGLVNLAKAGMTVTLFLIGTSLSRKMIATVGVKPMIQGIILWIAISVISLLAVLKLL